jgi:primosomal protein N' (replication factor Y)
VKAELTAREDLKYPPFAKLIKITVMHRNQSIAAKSALYLSLLLKKTLHERVLGPEKPHVGKVKNQFIYHTLIKCEPSEPISKIKAWINKQSLILHTLNEYKGCRIIFDVDPF